MSLADALVSGPPRSVAKCVLMRTAERLPDDEFAALRSMLHDTNWPVQKVLDAFIGEYPDLHAPHISTWQRHRRHECSCPMGAPPE